MIFSLRPHLIGMRKTTIGLSKKIKFFCVAVLGCFASSEGAVFYLLVLKLVKC